ncbi:MAG: hypothetical protein ACR2JC_10455 [Chloroflexota bacterium]|nr:MAG: hypothetical protein DLM70_06545 [Chloroflexota bacterium]
MGSWPEVGALTPFFLGTFFLAVYLLTGSSDLLHNGDTDLRYQTTQALVEHHRLWIDRPMWTDLRMHRGNGGHLYAFYGPGQVLLMVPLYVLGKAFAHHLSLPYDITTLYACRSLDLFLGALLAVVFYLFARSAGYTERISTVLTLIFGLATVSWPDAQSALEQTQVDLCLLVSVYAAWRYVLGDFARRRWLAAASAAAGAGLLTRYDFALYLPIILALPLAWRWRRQAGSGLLADVFVYVAGLVPWVLAVAAWNDARFGDPLDTGLREKTLGEPFLAGLAGLLVSPGKGLIWYLPLVLVLPWVVPRFYARCRPLCLLSASLVVVPVLFYSNLVYWHGDPAWGPRYLYTAVPYLILPLGELLGRWRTAGMGLRTAFLALLVVSAGLQLAAVSVTQWRFWYRLQAMEEHTRQPFRWGAPYYHYYWTPRQSPILIQIDDVYQIARLTFLGDTKYRFTTRPTAYTVQRHPSNPADKYPINNFAYWWVDPRHPLLGLRTRLGIAALLLAAALASLAAALSCAWLARKPPGESVVHARLITAGSRAL